MRTLDACEAGMQATGGVELCFADAAHCATAWSRHNVVAFAEAGARGTCVVLAELGQHGISEIVTRLPAPSRSPPFDGASSAPETLGAPTHISFSPCGYTLLAYFPALHPAPHQPNSLLLPCSTALQTPIMDQLHRSIPELPSTSTADGTVPFLPWNQGVLCVWTRAPQLPKTQWDLRQTLSVSMNPLFAPNLLGDIASVTWLGGPRQWNCQPDGQGFARAPAQGPTTFQAHPNLPLHEAQDEQVCVLVTNMGQLCFLHRLPQATLDARRTDIFRVHYAWLAQPSVQPPPATMESDSLAGTTPMPFLGCRYVGHVQTCPIAEEPVVLVAYLESATREMEIAASAGQVMLTEIQFTLNGAMSFYTVNPIEPLPLDPTPILRLDDPLPPELIVHGKALASMAWLPGTDVDDSVQLLFSLVVYQAPSEPAGTQLVSWAVRRHGMDLGEALAPLFSQPRPEATLDEAKWHTIPCATAWVEHHVCTSFYVPSTPIPFAHTLLATASSTTANGEIWATIHLDTLTFTPGVRLALELRARSSLAISPCGVLACTLLLPSAALAILPLPMALGEHSVLDWAGRLVGLSLLRQVSCTDVAHWAKSLNTPLTTQMPLVLQQTAASLVFGAPTGKRPTMHQLLVLGVVVLSLEHGAQRAETFLQTRMHLFVEVGHMYRLLSCARSDKSDLRFSAQLARGTTQFFPHALWPLHRVLCRLLVWMEHAVREATSGGAASNARPSVFFELLAYPEASVLFQDVLAGLSLYVEWVRTLSLDAWIAPAQPGKHPRTWYTDKASSLALAQKTVLDTAAHAPVDLRAAAQVLAGRASRAAWSDLFAMPASQEVAETAPKWTYGRVRRIFYGPRRW
ncbi:hypothetical protein MVES_001074 [Malassezia vespertilionis]|uniref:Uncharacterized protein n=1 Tax=Malassezia vespertilionis TaxID=2020962 RepID=A0A2N1JEE5_9BASI|nr:hypothetical protein MVES_001074 [Malassezia vespertilionis]